MRLLVFFYLALCAFAPRCQQETNSCDSIYCVQNNSKYCIDSNSERITVYFNAKYADIDSYIKDNIKISGSPAHKKRNKDIVNRLSTKNKAQIKSIINSYGINVRYGIFVINPIGKLEVVSFFLAGDNAHDKNVLSQRKIRSMFDQLYNNIEFSPWDDDEVRECITVRFE